tara:strand:- start:85 stop:717 length:633 start_codon:yes stop_codon:yes gene_type:complete
MKKFLGIIVLGLLLSGCDENPFKKYYGNTVFRVENCMKETSTKLIEEDIIKATCVKKIQEAIVDDFITGKSSISKRYSYDDNEKLYLKARIKNISGNLVYTQLKLTIDHRINYGELEGPFGENCSQKKIKGCKLVRYEKVFDDLWLQPKSSKSFELDLSEENFSKLLEFNKKIKLKKINFLGEDKMDGDNIIKKSNWSWAITSEKGVVIK